MACAPYYFTKICTIATELALDAFFNFGGLLAIFYAVHICLFRPYYLAGPFAARSSCYSTISLVSEH